MSNYRASVLKNSKFLGMRVDTQLILNYETVIKKYTSYIRLFALVVILLCFSGSMVFANSQSINPVLTVEGNTKTKLSFLRSLVNECLDEQNAISWDDIDESQLSQCVLDSKVFSEVELSVNNPEINIKVKERWTIVPIPYVRAQRDSKQYGLFIFDSNFLGRGKKAVVGGSTGNRGSTLFFLYRDPMVFYSRWTALAKYKKGQDDYVQYQGNVELNGYTQNEDTTEFRGGYKIKPWLEIAAQLELSRRSFDKLEPFNLSLENYRYAYLGPFFEYDRTDYQFYFQEGLKARLEAGSQIYRSDDSLLVAQYQFYLDWQYNAILNHALEIHFESRSKNSNDVRDSYKLGGGFGFRGVESNGIWAKQANSVAFDYKIPVWDIKFGTWTIGPFIDYAVFTPYDGNASQHSFSYGASIFMFVKKIAIPGVGIFVGHNDNYLGDFVSFAIGFGF